MIAGQIEIQMMANMARLAADMEQAKKHVGSAMENINEAVEGAKKGLEALGIGLGLHEFYEMIKGSIEANARLEDLSKTMSLSVETLAGLQFAAKSTGSDLDSVSNTVSKLAENMGKTPEKFTALGITAKDPLKAFEQLADIFKQIDDPQLKAALGAETMGKSWKTAAPLLAEGGDELEALVDKGTRLTGITSESAKQANEFNNKMLELAGTGGLLNKMVTPLLPLLNFLADDFIKARDEAGGMDSSFKPLLETGKAFTVLFGNIGFVLKGIGTEMGGLAAQITLITSGQFKEAVALGDIMKKEAADSRTAFDEWEKHVLAVGTAADSTAAKVKQASAEELAAAKAAAAIAKARAEAFVRKDAKDNTEKEEQRIREALATLQAKTLDEWVAANDKLQAAKDQAGLKDDQRIGYQWSKTLEDIEKRKVLLQDYGMWTVAREQEYNDAKVNAAGVASAAMIKLGEAEAKARQAVLQGALGSISSLMSSKNKELFEIGKAASIANATISTIEGATKALSYGPYLGPPLAALVWAAGLANVSMIASTQIGGGASSPTNATLGGGGSSTPTPVYGGNPGGPSTPARQNNDQVMSVSSNLTINAPGADEGVVSRIRQLVPALIAENKTTVYNAVNQVLASKGRAL